MAARKRKVALTDDWKQNIRASMIMNRLVSHIEGGVDLTPTQINAAKIVLGKILPDLARSEMTGIDGGPVTLAAIDMKGLSDTELEQMNRLVQKAAQKAITS
jgi:hypothetical protein